MDTISTSFAAVFPLLAYMAIGFFLKKRGFFKGDTADEVNRLVFNVFLPLNIFASICGADLRSGFSWRTPLYVVISCILSFWLVTVSVKKLEHDRLNVPVIIQGIHKSNYVLLSVSIVSSFFGSEIGSTALLVAFLTPAVNTCAVISFVTCLGDGRVSTGALVKKTLKNPLVLSSIIGIAANLVNLPVPDFIMSGVIKKLSAMATPLALLALGSKLDFSTVRKYSRQLIITSVGRLIVYPALFLFPAVLLGIRGADLLAVTVYCAAPTAVNSYSTAASMGGNDELAGEIVIVTSVLSILTLFLWMCLMGSFGWYA